MFYDGELYIYHEKQVSGLCAVHCLNNLLQGPYFTEIDLMHIAKELDEKERQVMMEMGTETKDFLNFIADDSGNVADDGNYSIQVLSRALAVFSLQAIPLLSPEMKIARNEPLKEGAFICNFKNHWITIRKFEVNGFWYNLNSLQDVPSYLSEFYLSAFLDTLLEKGYSIFCIRGILPCIHTDPLAIWKNSNWRKISQRSFKYGRSNEELKDFDERTTNKGEAGLQLNMPDTSSYCANTATSSSIPITCDESNENSESDLELQEAIRLSEKLFSTQKMKTIANIAEQTLSSPEMETTTGSDICHISFRLTDGSCLRHQFNKNDSILSLYQYLEEHGYPKDKFLLKTNFPKMSYIPSDQTLFLAGLHTNVLLILERKT